MPTVSSRRTLHVVSGDSACGSLRQALASVGRRDDVLPFRDDLSCGPLDPDDPDLREEWWSFGDEGFMRASIRSFWEAIDASEARIIVWHGRHSARDLSFFLHWADRLGERPYDIIDVTGQRPAYLDRDGQPAVADALVSVGTTPTLALPTLLGTERSLTTVERMQAVETWRRLKAENAYFRVVTEHGLASAPEDHFDASLLSFATHDWTHSWQVVGKCLSRNWESYIQVDALVLAMRLEALVEAGRLLAEGDVWNLQSSRIRLPE